MTYNNFDFDEAKDGLIRELGFVCYNRYVDGYRDIPEAEGLVAEIGQCAYNLKQSRGSLGETECEYMEKDLEALIMNLGSFCYGLYLQGRDLGQQAYDVCSRLFELYNSPQSPSFEEKNALENAPFAEIPASDEALSAAKDNTYAENQNDSMKPDELSFEATSYGFTGEFVAPSPSVVEQAEECCENAPCGTDEDYYPETIVEEQADDNYYPETVVEEQIDVNSYPETVVEEPSYSENTSYEPVNASPSPFDMMGEFVAPVPSVVDEAQPVGASSDEYPETVVEEQTDTDYYPETVVEEQQDENYYPETVVEESMPVDIPVQEPVRNAFDVMEEFEMPEQSAFEPSPVSVVQTPVAEEKNAAFYRREDGRMVCNDCGFANPVESFFCSNCGKRLVD